VGCNEPARGMEGRPENLDSGTPANDNDEDFSTKFFSKELSEPCRKASKDSFEIYSSEGGIEVRRREDEGGSSTVEEVLGRTQLAKG